MTGESNAHAFLKTTYPFAAEILTFYERVSTVAGRDRRRLRIVLEERGSRSERRLRDSMDVDVVLPQVKDALARILPASPAPLETFLAGLLERSSENWAVRLQQYVDSGGPRPGAALIPWKNWWPGFYSIPMQRCWHPGSAPGRPVLAGMGVHGCDARPVLGILRPEETARSDFLQCSFCATEWESRRIYCAFCGEDREPSLPVYVAEKFPHIRVEACDTCRRCLRTVDLTRDGNAVPEVDDLAAIPLGFGQKNTTTKEFTAISLEPDRTIDRCGRGSWRIGEPERCAPGPTCSILPLPFREVFAMSRNLLLLAVLGAELHIRPGPGGTRAS
jgi:hypothetical protein